MGKILRLRQILQLTVSTALLVGAGSLGLNAIAGASVAASRVSQLTSHNVSTASASFHDAGTKTNVHRQTTACATTWKKTGTFEVKDTKGTYIAVKAVTVVPGGTVTFARTYPLAHLPLATDSATAKAFVGSTAKECGFAVDPIAVAPYTTGVLYHLTVAFYRTATLVTPKYATAAFLQETHLVDLTVKDYESCAIPRNARPTSSPRAINPTTYCGTALRAVRYTFLQLNSTKITGVEFGNWSDPTTTMGGVAFASGYTVGANAIESRTLVTKSVTVNATSHTTACFSPDGCFDATLKLTTNSFTIAYTPLALFGTSLDPSGSIPRTFTSNTYLPEAPAFTTARIGYVFNLNVTAPQPKPTLTSITPNSGSVKGGNTVTLHCKTLAAGTVHVVWGVGNTPGSSIFLNATTFTVNGTTITVTVPAHTGTGSIKVEVVNGTPTTPTTLEWFSSALTYTYISSGTNGTSGAHLSAGSLVSATTTGEGYWTASASGGVFSYTGAAGDFHGSLPGLGVHVTDITGIAGTCDNGGYWLAGSDGGVFAFGDALYFGSLPELHVTPNQPIVGIESSSDCGGYYLLGADGGIFAFGDATFEGSLPFSSVSVDDAVGMSVVTDGYFIVTADGGVFCYGTAKTDFHGSLPGLNISTNKVIGMVPTLTLGGYYLVSSDGGVFAFGNAVFVGSEGGAYLTSPVIGLVLYPATSSKAYLVINQLGIATPYNKLT